MSKNKLNQKSVTYEPISTEDLTKFFSANKEIYHEIWIVLAKKEKNNPQPVSFKEAVNEAIKQGLIDSRTKSLNEEKYAIRFTKRKKQRN